MSRTTFTLQDVGDVTLGDVLPDANLRYQIKKRAAAQLATAPTTMPTSVNLIPRFNPIRNQLSRPTCTAFALSAMHEAAKYVAGKPKPNFSEQYLFYKSNKLFPMTAATCGIATYYAAETLAKSGQCLETTWPYYPYAHPTVCNANGTALPANAEQAAKANSVNLLVLPAYDIMSIKTCLATGRAVAAAFQLFNTQLPIGSVFSRTGFMAMPPATARKIGGHAMCIVGYQNSASATYPGGGYFIIRNSWGTGTHAQSPFGAGYCYCPYNYVRLYCHTAVSTTLPGQVGTWQNG